MPTDPKESNVTEMANWLKMRKSANRRTVLFLGARTGGLFRSKDFYDQAQQWSNRAFNELSQIEQFGECYQVLNHFSESDLDGFFTLSLKNVGTSEADACVTELVKQDLFDVIITTNIDDLLEQAFREGEMKEIHDFRVFIPRQSSSEEIIRPGIKLSCTMVKVFGDLTSKEYKTAKRVFKFENYEKLEKFLEYTMAREILVIGYDPIWDREIGRSFLPKGQDFWYVNEEKPKDDSPISEVLCGRQGKFIVGVQGSYESFLRGLHWHLLGGRPPKTYQLTNDIFINLKEIRDELRELQDIHKAISALKDEIRKLANSRGEK